MLKYKCLLCGIEWGDQTASESDVSHGYCPNCIRSQYTERIHKAQLKEGYSDCFNRGYNNCTEGGCSFRGACQESSVSDWEEKVIGGAGAPAGRRFRC